MLPQDSGLHRPDRSVRTGGAWGGGWMGCNGGIWMPILLVVVVVALVVWVVKQRK